MTRSQRAIQFAAKAHAGQTRKGSGEPYVVHPLRTAVMVGWFCSYEDTIIATLLHAVLEKSDVTTEEIVREFGDDVCVLVCELTDSLKNDRTTPRAERKRQYAERLGQASYMARLIKVCDRIDNLWDMADVAFEGFRKLYAEESEMLLSKIGYGLPEELTDELREAIAENKGGA